ncbi:hypothetical protein BDA99DRAFT_80274 [Phascolomyces articulosus]|uniref:Sld7 C-terminal domain-containing protein n=1 Tax=Phascolomyces articulosus TaxID=60185 RepID=A0AAD5K987_9FUNG|nr:hypothetical protein BDA99DRAFT_80274 [Phascolomyces articulosus]
MCYIFKTEKGGKGEITNKYIYIQGNYKHSVHGLLLECVEDKDEIMEDGVENPFIERTKYPLFSPSYILLYVETDNEGNDCICAQLFQSRFNDDATTRILSQLYYHPSHMLTMHENKNDSDDNVHVNYLEALGFFIDETIPSQEIVSTYQWKWDLLGARDQDRMEKERLKQLQRPDFFAKPRPKPVPKKRSHIDLNYLLERQGAVGTSNASHTNRSSTSTTAKTTGSPSTNSKSKRKDMTSSSEQTRKKKTTAAASNDSWETENKETIKKRLWGTMSKHRGHDRRSEKSKLLYQQIYQSCQYVFRHTMKDEQINSQLLDQVIEKHLGFYEDLDLSFSTAL